MLILSRKKNQKIIICDGLIEIMVVDIRRKTNDVQLGITAPREWPVHREEVAEKIKRQLTNPEPPV